jgi:hypothetical protein
MKDDPSPASAEVDRLSETELHTVLLASLIGQLSQLALFSLGKLPDPESGVPAVDLAQARVFIDQLEMLAVKTRGNLSRQEEGLLQESLTALRLAFVEAANAAPPSAPAPPAAPSSQAETSNSAPSESAADDRKKFVKKY